MGSDPILTPSGELLGVEGEMPPQPAQLERNLARKGQYVRDLITRSSAERPAGVCVGPYPCGS